MANTPNGYPYPAGTDPVAQGDDAIKALALAIDARLGPTYSTRVAAGSVPANGTANVVVPFPAGRFTAAPIVELTPEGSSNLRAVVSALTKDSLTITFRNDTGTVFAAGYAHVYATKAIP